MLAKPDIIILGLHVRGGSGQSRASRVEWMHGEGQRHGANCLNESGSAFTTRLAPFLTR